MKKIIEYYYMEYGASLFSSPKFHHKEVIEVKTHKELQKYIENQKDQMGHKFKKKDSFGFDYISNQGAIKVRNYIPDKIKQI